MKLMASLPIFKHSKNAKTKLVLHFCNVLFPNRVLSFL